MDFYKPVCDLFKTGKTSLTPVFEENIMSENPTVSVVINFFNGEKYLRECLDSVINQTFKDFEVILWDNQSKDRSAEIVKSYQDSRLRYFYAPNFLPLGPARNAALEYVKGKWVGFIDCDDLWLPDKLLRQIQLVENDSEVGLVYTRCHFFTDDNKETDAHFDFKSLPEGNILEALLLDRNFINLSAALLRKDVLFSLGKIPVHLKQAEDYYLFAGVATKSKVAAVQSVECKVRIHEHNLTNKQTIEALEESIFVINRFKNNLKLNSNQTKDLQNRLVDLNTWAALMRIKYRKEWKNSIHALIQNRALIYAFLCILDWLVFKLRKLFLGEQTFNKKIFTRN